MPHLECSRISVLDNCWHKLPITYIFLRQNVLKCKHGMLSKCEHLAINHAAILLRRLQAGPARERGDEAGGVLVLAGPPRSPLRFRGALQVPPFCLPQLLRTLNTLCLNLTEPKFLMAMFPQISIEVCHWMFMNPENNFSVITLKALRPVLGRLKSSPVSV